MQLEQLEQPEQPEQLEQQGLVEFGDWALIVETELQAVEGAGAAGSEAGEQESLWGEGSAIASVWVSKLAWVKASFRS